MDPYRSGALNGAIRHAPVECTADIVTISHYHVDHSHIGPGLVNAAGQRPTVVDSSCEAHGLTFEGRTTYHDCMLGAHMGLSTMFVVELDGLRVAHLGDIGCPLCAADSQFLTGVDVLLWPVGGTYTLGPKEAQALLDIVKPRVAIPLHFENERCTLGMEPIEALGPALRDGLTRPGHTSWESSSLGSDETTQVVALEPAL